MFSGFTPAPILATTVRADKSEETDSDLDSQRMRSWQGVLARPQLFSVHPEIGKLVIYEWALSTGSPTKKPEKSP